jgi:hypothetical protein
MYKAVLNSVQLLYVIYDSPTCFGYKVLYKSISTNRHTNTNKTFRAERSEGDIRMKGSQSVVDDAVRELLMMLCATSNAACCVTPLGRTEVLEMLKSSILLEDILELSQDL